MKGLLLKDFISMKRQLKATILLVLVYTALSLIQKSIAFLCGMITLVSIMLPIASLGYDEVAKWDRYALSMPVSRKNLIWSKYCLGILSGLAGTFFSILIGLCFLLPQNVISLSKLLLTSFTVFEISIIVLSIIMPLLFQFGVEKGRIVLMAVVCIPLLFVFLLDNMGIPMPNAATIQLLGMLLPFFVLAFFFSSVWISIRIYNKKEI